jgi:hypothetical protein
MTTTYVFDDIHEVVEVGIRLGRSWFRGHASMVDQLTPRVFREPYADPVISEARPELELELIEAFKSDARALAATEVPSEDDRLGWLYLMQHYTAPTRLLDWTESILVALYFVVHEQPGQDGELWAMYPQALNEAGEVGPGMPLMGQNPVLNYLMNEPYLVGSQEVRAKKCELDAPPVHPAAFFPRRTFARMVAQSSVFTIHPVPGPGLTIPELLLDERHLVRYVVPHTRKRELAVRLTDLGITHRAVFPDFEGLAKHVVRDSHVVAYAPPAPPKASGLWAGPTERQPPN